jgi:predicted nucleotidyltransferase
MRASQNTWEAVRPSVTAALLGRICDRIVCSFHPLRIVLFGSHATGRANGDSDVDLLVVATADRIEGTPAQRISQVATAAREPFLPLDIVVLTPEEWEQRRRASDPLVADIERYGMVLYEAAP